MTTTASGKERFEVLFDADMLKAIKVTARMMAITPSAWIKIQCVAGLHAQGIVWGQDHPEGDQSESTE